MKKILYSILMCSFVFGLVSCSNGDYAADLDSPANGAVNPITPLTSEQFTWGGTDPLSADINGRRWVADSVYFTLDTAGGNIITAMQYNSPVYVRFYLRDVWAGNTYSMEWKDYYRSLTFTDSFGSQEGYFYSYLSNSGGVHIDVNDTAVIKGKFYCKGVSVNGQTVNISNGYFNINKW